MEILQIIATGVMITLLGKYLSFEIEKIKGDIQQVKTAQRASKKREHKMLKKVR